MDCWIISIGNEILIGKVVNTNASWLAEKLTHMGIKVRRIVSVPDEMDEITEVIRDGLSRSDILILTGGLGPTFDDITNIALAKALDRELVINQEAYEEIKRKYGSQGLPLTEERIKMSKMPKGAVSLYNPIGTAPGILVETDGKVVIALPGVPAEMKGIFNENLSAFLAGFSKAVYMEDRFIVRGVPESKAAPIIKEVFEMNPHVYIKSHPKGAEFKAPVLEIHLTAIGTKEDELKEGIEETRRELMRKLREIGGAIIT